MHCQEKVIISINLNKNIRFSFVILTEYKKQQKQSSSLIVFKINFLLQL